MKPIKLETDINLFLMMCDSLLSLSQVGFESTDQRTRYMEIRYRLAPKLMRHMVKEPVPNNIKLSYTEADLVVFAVKQYNCRTSTQEGFCRRILMQLDGKIQKTTDYGPPILIETPKEENTEIAEEPKNKFRWMLP